MDTGGLSPVDSRTAAIGRKRTRPQYEDECSRNGGQGSDLSASRVHTSKKRRWDPDQRVADGSQPMGESSRSQPSIPTRSFEYDVYAGLPHQSQATAESMPRRVPPTTSGLSKAEETYHLELGHGAMVSGLHILEEDRGLTQLPFWSRNSRCQMCLRAGHEEAECPSRTCRHCEAYNEHFSNACPTRLRCARCRQPGHSVTNCHSNTTVAYKDKVCDLCQARGHIEDQCSLLWRTFHPETIAEVRKVQRLVQSCYNCGSDQHWGDDCPDRLPIFKSKTFSNSFSGSEASLFLLGPHKAAQGMSIKGRAGAVKLGDHVWPSTSPISRDKLPSPSPNFHQELNQYQSSRAAHANDYDSGTAYSNGLQTMTIQQPKGIVNGTHAHRNPSGAPNVDGLQSTVVHQSNGIVNGTNECKPPAHVSSESRAPANAPTGPRVQPKPSKYQNKAGNGSQQASAAPAVQPKKTKAQKKAENAAKQANATPVAKEKAQKPPLNAGVIQQLQTTKAEKKAEKSAQQSSKATMKQSKRKTKLEKRLKKAASDLQSQLQDGTISSAAGAKADSFGMTKSQMKKVRKIVQQTQETERQIARDKSGGVRTRAMTKRDTHSGA